MKCERLDARLLLLLGVCARVVRGRELVAISIYLSEMIRVARKADSNDALGGVAGPDLVGYQTKGNFYWMTATTSIRERERIQVSHRAAA